MNKIQIKKFLESEEETTIENIRNIRNREVEKLKEKIVIESLKGLDVKELEIEIKTLLKELKQIDMYFEKSDSYSYYNSYTRQATYYLESLLNRGGLEKDILKTLNKKSYMSDKPTVKYEAQREQIRNEYTKLKGNISSMTGAQATEYLKELGFKIPETNVVKNEVMSTINISLLKELRGE
jgi:hypothetical protein